MVLFVSGMPGDPLGKPKVVVAIQQKVLGEHSQEMCTAHVQELEKNGCCRKGSKRHRLKGMGERKGLLLTKKS